MVKRRSGHRGQTRGRYPDDVSRGLGYSRLALPGAMDLLKSRLRLWRSFAARGIARHSAKSPAIVVNLPSPKHQNSANYAAKSAESRLRSLDKIFLRWHKIFKLISGKA